MERIILLGFLEGSATVIVELGVEIFQCFHYDIIKNVDQGEVSINFPSVKCNSYRDKEYDFSAANPKVYHFGVLHSHIKYILFNHFYKNYQITKGQYINIIHPFTYIAKSTVFDNGILIEPGTVVSSQSQIGFGVTMKRSVSVGHHNVIGDFVNLNPGVTIAGDVVIGEGTEIGSGTVISDNITIGSRCLIGAGSFVNKDIPDGMVAYGNPCKVIRQSERWSKMNV